MRTRLQNYLITGLLVIMPLAVTYVVLRWLFNTLDNMLQPVLFPFFGHIPGLGVLTGVALLLVARAGARRPPGPGPPARAPGRPPPRPPRRARGGAPPGPSPGLRSVLPLPRRRRGARGGRDGPHRRPHRETLGRALHWRGG